MSAAPVLEHDAVHVWQVALDDSSDLAAHRRILSVAERARADQFFQEYHGVRYTVAHGWLRRILERYVQLPAQQIDFTSGEFGKPALAGDATSSRIEFNLSHSGDLALIAVAVGRPVGVDVERWDDRIEHLELADHFFSPSEREALRGLAHAPEEVVAGFFSAWSRKEAYLKASGHGITRGLHHFDVSLNRAHGQLLADRLDEDATGRWVMRSLDIGAGYSAALVVAAPLRDVVLLQP